MVVFCYLLLAILVLHANGEGVYLEHSGSLVFNFGLLGHSEIDNTISAAVGLNLVCRTDNTSCCRNSDNPYGLGFGNWYYPEGDMVVFNAVTPPSGQIYRMIRNMQVVRLRLDDAATITATANGIYRCEVADQNGVTQTHYAGLYTDGAGAVSISQAPQFSLTSIDTLEFTLTSTTTGGPPTTAQWTLPDGTMLSHNDNKFSQAVVSGTTSTVEHTLTVTGRLTGEYVFTTANSRTSPTVSMSIMIQAANPPSGLMVVQSDLTSIDISWSAPASGGATRTSYRIIYETRGNEQSVIVGAGATSHTLIGLQSGATYSISIVALSDTLPITVRGPVMVTVEGTMVNTSQSNE